MTGSEGLGVDIVREMAAAVDPALADRPVVGIGWGTVDLDRAALLSSYEDGSTWLPVARDELLGAKAIRRSDVDSESPVLVLLEPDTEGRLAAFLARFGEGMAAIYLAGDGGSAHAPGSRGRSSGRGPRAGARLGPPALGPLGRGRLLLGLPWWGPHVIVLEPEETA